MVTFVCNTEYKKGKTTLMINKHDGRQFTSEYTVMCVCIEGETERARKRERVIKCKSEEQHLLHKRFPHL